MEEWIWIKGLIGSWAGLDSGALHVLASILLLLTAASLFRRPVSSWLPWTVVLLAEIANEAVTAFADHVLEDWERIGSLQDIVLVMLAPTVLLIAARSAPRLFGIEPTQLVRTWSSGRPKPEIIDAQFEEIPIGDVGSTPA